MVEIVDLLFYQILKLNPSQVSGNFQSDFVYLLLIPTIIIILILQGLPKIFGVTSKGLRTLISIGGLAIIIERGWYGTLASLGTTFFIIGLILAIISTFWFKIFKKEHAAGALKTGDFLRRQVSKRSIGSYLPSNKSEAIHLLKGLDTEYEGMAKEIAAVSKVVDGMDPQQKEAAENKLVDANARRSELVVQASRILEAFGWTPDNVPEKAIKKNDRLYNRLKGKEEKD